MPQIFQVLRCYKCLVFQVHQTKKSNKWECKLCGEKQSVKRHYGIGTAKDCRKLNSMRGEKDELKYDAKLHSQGSDDSDEIDTLEDEKVTYQPKTINESKWSNFVEEKVLAEEINEEPVYLGNAEVVLEIPKKRKKQFNAPRSNYNTTSSKQNIDHDIECSNKEIYKPPRNQTSEQETIYKPPCYNTSEKESFNIPDLKPIQEKSSQYYQLDIPAKNLIEKENFKPNIIQPVINKNSKWAEYVEEEVEELSTEQSSDVILSQTDHMFSQCDDSELDSVLDI